MKKIVLMLSMAAVCFSASAALEDRMWVSLTTVAPLMGVPAEDGSGYGAGWYVEAFNVTQNGGLAFTMGDVNSIYSTIMLGDPSGVSPVLGEYGTGGYILDNAIFGIAKDLDQVQLVMYDNADKSLASMYLSSVVLALPDAPEVAGPTDINVNFDFTGQTWQAIPEPATVLLFGIGGMGAWLLRRRQQA